MQIVRISTLLSHFVGSWVLPGGPGSEKSLTPRVVHYVAPTDKLKDHAIASLLWNPSQTDA